MSNSDVAEPSMVPIILVVVAIVIGVGSQMYLKPDNYVEEAAEEVIKNQTGREVDLSPGGVDIN